jgi:hypothetical protein
MKGFHVCKSGNAPTVGQVKSLIIAGDRIKSKALDQGGQNYTITAAVQRESYKDSYGNVGYDIEIEPVNGTQSTQVDRGGAGTFNGRDDTGNRIERQHSQEMMLRYFAMIGGFPEGKSQTDAMREMTSWFQRDIGHLPERKSEPAPPPPQDEEEEIPF